jgi:hypothetical protein
VSGVLGVDERDHGCLLRKQLSPAQISAKLAHLLLGRRRVGERAQGELGCPTLVYTPHLDAAELPPSRFVTPSCAIAASLKIHLKYSTVLKIVGVVYFLAGCRVLAACYCCLRLMWERDKLYCTCHVMLHFQLFAHNVFL